MATTMATKVMTATNGKISWEDEVVIEKMRKDVCRGGIGCTAEDEKWSQAL
jgi:hypothetical protein